MGIIDIYERNLKRIEDLESQLAQKDARIAELECNTNVTLKGQKQDRLSSYKKVGEYLKDKGAPSHIWSELEKLLEPNGIFLRQRSTIKNLEARIENLLEGLKKMRLITHYEYMQNEIEECLKRDSELDRCPDAELKGDK